MRKITGLLFVLITFGLVACQQEPDNIFDDDQPDIQDLPKKIVEVDVNNDSAIILMSYSASGQLEKTTTSGYEAGTLAYSYTRTMSYYPDGKINWHVARGVDQWTGETYRIDQFFFKDAAGRISGFRVTDSGSTSPPTYYKYLYNNNNRLVKVIEELDSINYFSSNTAAYYYRDSMIYDASGLLTEYHRVSTNLISGESELKFSAFAENFDPRQNFIPTGINNYSIFEDIFLLSGNNPASFNFKDHVSGDFDFISCNTTYDAQDRPVKMDYTSLGDYSFNYSLEIGSMKQRFIYY